MKKFTIILLFLYPITTHPKEPVQLDPIVWTTPEEQRICFTLKGAKRLLEIYHDHKAQKLAITTYKSLIYNLEQQIIQLESINNTTTEQLTHLTKQNIMLIRRTKKSWYQSEVLWFTLGIIVTGTAVAIIYGVKK